MSLSLVRWQRLLLCKLKNTPAADFGELLAVVRPLSPAASFTGLVARGALSLGLSEPVLVTIFSRWAGNDFVPLDCLDVTQVVVVQDSNASR